MVRGKLEITRAAGRPRKLKILLVSLTIETLVFDFWFVGRGTRTDPAFALGGKR